MTQWLGAAHSSHGAVRIGTGPACARRGLPQNGGMTEAQPAAIDASTLRSAGPDLLSLALMEARNRTLRWLAAFEAAPPLAPPPDLLDLSPPLWMAGHAGWMQEYWIARHMQRQRGERSDPDGIRLASIEPDADRWWHPAHSTPAERWLLDLPSADAVRRWLVDTLETTLDLLPSSAASDDELLYFFRAVLHHEDLMNEQMAVLAQALDLPAAQQNELWTPLPARVARDALWFPAQRWQLGSAPGGFVPDTEKWAHEVSLPEFEIDAQAVNWAQFVEFVEDGGYDEPRWWTREGGAWLRRHTESAGPRSPRYVEQLRRGVLVQRQGRLQRVPLAQPALHLSLHEAQAWCHWAGRRLPTEAEWELAAQTGRSRGCVWGDVWEWVAGSARHYPGHRPGPMAAPEPEPGALAVQRGGSWMTPARQRHPKMRRFVLPGSDEQFCGFRSCAI
jgi:iron(II)-dependent oxidoreductase